MWDLFCKVAFGTSRFKPDLVVFGPGAGRQIRAKAVPPNDCVFNFSNTDLDPGQAGQIRAKAVRSPTVLQIQTCCTILKVVLVRGPAARSGPWTSGAQTRSE